jgi:hypothetical protein
MQGKTQAGVEQEANWVDRRITSELPVIRAQSQEANYPASWL